LEGESAKFPGLGVNGRQPMRQTQLFNNVGR